MPRNIVVIGGAVSGPTAALAAKKRDPRARILLLERNRDVNYIACGISYRVSGEAKPEASTAPLPGIEVRTGVEVSSIDARQRVVVTSRNEEIGFDSLIYAAGAASVLPDIPNLESAQNVSRFRTLRDAEGIEAMLAHGARRVAVLGGSFIGLEAVDALLRRRCLVTIVEKAKRLLPRFNDDLASAAHSALKSAGATVRLGVSAVEAERSGARVTALKLSDGSRVEMDFVVAAIGLRPRTELLARAGARLCPDATVAIDAYGKTSLRGVFACGVCVALPHAVTGKPIWFAQASQADKTAWVAGINAAGGKARLGRVANTAILHVGELTLGRTGLSRGEAKVLVGARLRTARAQGSSREAFLPGSTPLSVELYFDSRGGRVLGGEVWGAHGVDKRLDVLATAIVGGLSVRDLAWLDLAYEPSFSTARDPIHAAAAEALAA